MKVLQTGLNQQAPVLVYDKTKPYLAGRTFSKSISGLQVYGPPLTAFINTQSDTGLAPAASRTTPNGRHFQLLTVIGGIATFALYTIDQAGQAVPGYLGKIQVRLPNAAATTHVMRGFEVYDGANNAAVTGWQIYLGTTGTTPINGGLFVVHNVAQSDFSPLSPPLIEMAIVANTKAVYMLQDPGTIGVNNTLTAMQGLALDRTSRRLYFHNNVLASTQWAVFDPSASLTIVTQTTTAATVSGSPTFTLTAHGYSANDPVVLTANAPTGFTASTNSTAQTVYFIRNPAANTFELSATSGGVSINAGSITTATIIQRAFGATTGPWLSLRTGTITGISGTILLSNCEQVVTPLQSLDSNIPASLNNQVCVFFATSTGFYLLKVSEITNGAVTFPTMSSVNVTGTGTDYTAIIPSYAEYSETTGRIIYISNSSQLYIKLWLNNAISMSFGGTNTLYLENALNAPYTFAGVTVLNFELRLGWAYLTLGTVGQRGVMYMDLRSDASFNYSFITTPTLDTSSVLTPRTLITIEKLFDLTSSMVFSYKTKATFSDVAFNDPTTGFTVVPFAVDLSAIALSNFTQFRIDFDISQGDTNTPSQLNELYLAYTPRNELSDNWSGSVDNTSANGVSPSYSAFRLQTAYLTSVPTLYFRAFDDSNNLVASANTTTNPTLFDFSVNNGTSWAALGTIPNTILTTEVRYKWSTPPGVRVQVSLRES